MENYYGLIELALVVGALLWFYRSQMRALRRGEPAPEDEAEASRGEQGER